MERRKAAWLTPATSRSCVTASITTGCAPTASTSSVIRGSSRVSTHGARSNIEGSAPSMPDVSLPHIGWPPTRSTPSAAAHSITVAFVLAISVMGLPPALGASCANSSRSALTGAPTTMMSAISTTLRSVFAMATMPRSRAFRTTTGLRSLPTIVVSGLGGVDDHWQVGKLAYQRHGVEVEREAGRRLERADAALGKDHVPVALGEDVLRGKQPLLDGRRHTALEKHRLARAPRLLKKGVVLHVASAQLQDVRVLSDEADVAGGDDLGHDLEACLGAGGGHHLQRRLAEALDGIGRGAWLERSAPRESSAFSPISSTRSTTASISAFVAACDMTMII